MRRTKEESERTREHILAAARREFSKHGVTRTTLQRIAVAAGVTRGAVYWHFDNKRALFQAMRDQVSLPLFDHSDVLSVEGPDPLATIERFLRGLIEQLSTDLKTRRTFDILALKCEYVDEFRSELRRHARRSDELMAKFALVYQRAREVGAMRSDITPAMAALGSCVFVTGVLRLWLMDEARARFRAQVDPLISSHIAMLRAPRMSTLKATGKVTRKAKSAIRPQAA